MLPPRFLDRLAQIVPPESLQDVVASFSAPQATGFRVNTLKAPYTEAVLKALGREGLDAQPVPGVAGAYTVPPEQRAGLLASEPYEAGAVYVQNPASQLPPLLLEPQPGDRVLDLCAAPGSKTTQLAALGVTDLTAVEKAKGRFHHLKANLVAQGAGSVETRLADGAQLWRRAPESFDRVLLDAPCSTEGRFRTDDPATTAYWSPRKIKEMRSKQRRLLFGAVQALKPGGTLVYATCTFAPEENEGVVSKALKQFGGALEAVPLALDPALPVQPPLESWNDRPFRDGTAHARRVLPDPARGFEAFFVARFVKHASTLRPPRP